MKATLTPRTKIKSKGKISYSESAQAWNILKLKKELFSEFPQLKEKRSKFSYELTYCRDPETLKKNMEELAKDGRIMPILLFLHRENN
ncbi:hypothetical protein HNV12_01710 [Methanococcoides sp. SA1]|nr:hypothetical protein [Methanococcoides sp. SA1]